MASTGDMMDVINATATPLTTMLDNYFANETNDFNMTNMTTAAEEGSKTSIYMSIVFKVAYSIGIFSNAAAIVALRVGESRVKNRKHLLLLTSLAVNDLVALVGMMCAMLVGELNPLVRSSWQFCAARVVLRVFGIGSVCIAVTMALERYLALTRPFLYQKQVTYFVIRMALVVSWVWAAVLTCAPVLGLGRYYDPELVTPGSSTRGGCVRYRDAQNTSDYVYAVFYVAFGTLLCVVLVYCNLAVMRALYAITAPRARARGVPVVRRVSKSSCRAHARGLASTGDLPHHNHNAATAEEVAFSRLMATLSVLFMICWMPQMVTSALYLSLGGRPVLKLLSNMSDVLMLLNYVLDPVLYVLMRRRPLAALANTLTACFKRKHKTSTESMSLKTSCCQQETCVVSDSSGAAELRPLRPPAPHPQFATGTLLKIDN